MSSTKPTVRGRPATSAAPKSPHTEENQGYRRGRAIRSCLECRRRKMRCNRSRPCQNCNRFCRECIYLPFPEWPSGAPINAKGEAVSQSPTQAGGRAIPSLDSNQYSRRVQTSLFTQTNHAYDSDTLVKHVALYDVDADDQNSDLGLQVGRLSITEKLNSFFRPHVANQVSISGYLQEGPFPLMPSAPGEGPHFSVNMRLQITALLSQIPHSASPYDAQNPYGLPATNVVSAKRILPLEPSPGLLGTISQSFLPQPGLELPSYKELCLLYYQYWSAVDPLAHIIHKPSFEVECGKYMPNFQVNDAAPVSFKALLLAICLAAAVSLPQMRAEEVLGVPQQTLVGRFKIATEKGLTDANFMSSGNIQTLQAFTIYLIPQCRAEISKLHTVYIGALIRLARVSGLNRDASSPEMDPVDCQVRRLLWHQICFLDLLAAEAQGSQPTIRSDEFDTALPLNVKDDALDRPNHEPIPTSGWTDATLSIIRYECCMVHRLIFDQRSAIENGHTDLKCVQHLVNVQKLRIERQYLQYLDEAIPIQRCAKRVGQLLTAGFDAILLHGDSQFDVNTDLQTDIRETLIQSCLIVCESAVALDTDPDLTPWAWYARINHQYENSIFLLIEVYRSPFSPPAERINRVLDHVFGANPSLSPRDRSRKLLQLLAEELNKMTLSRRVRNPQLTGSENGSSSPSDRSGMVKTPEDSGPWSHWQQPEVMYRHGYPHDLPPVSSDDGWWTIPPPPPGIPCGSTAPPHDGYMSPQQHDYYGY